MSSIHYRIFGQAVALGVHGVNSLVMFLSMQDQELMSDPEVQTMTSLQNRYLTVWNIFFQLLYFGVALSCDVATVTRTDHLLPKGLRKIRESLFSNFMFPITLDIVEIFWPLFLYDRSLIFPAFIDKIFSFKSNLVMHLAILHFALWELVFWPRKVPTSHKLNLLAYTSVCIVYIVLLLYTHAQRSVFPYPIFTMLYGTIYFPILLVIPFVLGIFNYLIQWKITAFIWDQRRKPDTKSRRKVK